MKIILPILLVLLCGCVTQQPYDFSKPSFAEKFVAIQDKWRSDQEIELNSFIGLSKEDLITSNYLSWTDHPKISSGSVEYHQECDQQTLNFPQVSTISGWSGEGPFTGEVETQPSETISHKNIERIIVFYLRDNKVYTYFDNLQHDGISAFCENMKIK